MNIGFYNNCRYYNKNRMLTSPQSPIGDDLMYPFYLLGKELIRLGHQVSTIDMGKDYDAIVFVEMPPKKYLKTNIPLYLIALESPIIKPDNYDQNNHNCFKKIFTWSDNLVDNKKYFKINYCHKKPVELNFGERDKLCTLIASNKFKDHEKELYSERKKAIRWFEKNHPEDFDLYGFGWDRHFFYGEFLGFNLLRLNRLKTLAKLLKTDYPSYKGTVKSKEETFKKYKFAICYENCRDFPGYITEKIFDSFFAGCVPIYLGADNITDHIPANTFVDKRGKTYEEIYNFIKNMPKEEYLNYQNNIKNFIQSEKFYQFTPQYFVETITREIL